MFYQECVFIDWLPINGCRSVVETCLPNHCIATVAARTHRKHNLSIVEAYLLSRCLAMSIHVTLYKTLIKQQAGNGVTEMLLARICEVLVSNFIWDSDYPG
jgi:hypothetical protein